MKTYQHTQPGATIVNSLLVLFVAFAIGSAFLHQLIIPTIGIAVVAWLFRSMTIEISDTELIWYFGSGFPRKRVSLGEIASTEIIRTRFIDGWGIHFTPRGWLYNVSGRAAVAITLKSGKQFCLGTDEPEKLAETLKRSS